MAPGFLGKHARVFCERCNYKLAFVRDQIPRNKLLVCSNCGNSDLDVSKKQLQIDGGVRIQRLDQQSTLGRWQIVAFKNPEKEQFSFKRIIGLPGETIGFQDGNVLANGKLVRQKPFAQPVEQLNLVFQFSQRIKLIAERLQEDSPRSSWSISAHEAKFSPPDHKRGISWLSYQHRHCYRKQKTAESSSDRIDDSYSINQNLARAPNPVTELRVDLSVQTDGQPSIFLKIHDGVEYRDVEIDLRNQIVKLGEFEESFSHISIADSLDISLSTFDDQVGVAINNRPILLQELASTKTSSSVADPLRIGGTSGGFTISSLSIYRDTYYFAEEHSRKVSWKLGADEYFVVGDNVPASRDSRHWAPHGIKRRQIIATFD